MLLNNKNSSLFFSAFAQLYVSAAGILMLPFLYKTLGAESYGLIGIFTMLQSVFSILDLGLSPTVTREVIKYKNKECNATHFFGVYSYACLFLLCTSILLAVISLSSIDYIIINWVKFEELDRGTVSLSFFCLFLCVIFRWLCGVYRGVFWGYEKINFISSLNVIFVTFKFFIVFFVFNLFGVSIAVFFLYQLALAIVEFAVLFLGAWKLLGLRISYFKLVPIASVIPVFKFAASIAATAAVWTIITQSDKLIMSSAVNLKDYAVYSLVVVLSGGILVISGSLSAYIMPRLTNLYTQKLYKQLADEYNSLTGYVSLSCLTLAVVIALNSEHVLYVWTGDYKLSSTGCIILSLYSLANGVFSIISFSYYLQYAMGNLRLHMLGNLLMLIFFLPCLYVAANEYGAVGAGACWLCFNITYILLWVTYTHRCILPNIAFLWLSKNFILVIFVSFALSYLLRVVFGAYLINRLFAFCYLASSYFIVVLACWFFYKKFKLQMVYKS